MKGRIYLTSSQSGASETYTFCWECFPQSTCF
uniref:Uncharacterized protein n=1 Tax=Rhizophora mucronata TaxID=61149 RepID=A0A2P2P8Z9_RHIMU